MHWTRYALATLVLIAAAATAVFGQPSLGQTDGGRRSTASSSWADRQPLGFWRESFSSEPSLQTGLPLRNEERPGQTEKVAAAAEAWTPTASTNDAASQPTEVADDSSDATDDASDRELTPELIALREKVRQCLAHYFFRPESTENRGPWSVMHAFIAFGVDTQLYAGDRQVNAIAWTCWNGPCMGRRLFYTEREKIRVRVGAGYQGHEGQFLAIVAQCRVPSDYGMKVDGHEFTIADVIRLEMETCRPATELTFKLIGLSYYLDSDATWRDKWGGQWSIPRLIDEELKQPIVGATCGGTHRLMGFTYAVRKREESSQPLDGQWKRAKTYLSDFHDYTFKLQNPDGSFSTSWFEGRADFGGIDRRLQTTGHILEWFVWSLPDDQLTDPRVVKSVEYLTDLMWENRDHRWEIGPKGHALHALALYDERVFGGMPGKRGVVLAETLRKSQLR